MTHGRTPILVVDGSDNGSVRRQGVVTDVASGEPKRCLAPRKDGMPCPVTVLVDGRYCFAHSPKLHADRTEARRRGGHNRATAVRLRALMPPRLVPVFDRLEAALAETHAGDLDPKQATAMAALARAMVAVLTSGELEERLRKLEEGMG